MMPDERMLTTAEAAKQVGVSVPTITSWVNSGWLAATRVAPPGGGRPGLQIREDDLLDYNRRRLSGGVKTANPTMSLTLEDKRADALSLEVFWPAERRKMVYSPAAVFDGYRGEFRCVTYTASIEAILGLLVAEPGFDLMEVVFGNAELLTGDKAHPLIMQRAIEDAFNQGFQGVAGAESPIGKRILEQPESGRLRLLAMAPGIVHSKYYMLSGEKGRRVLVGSANLSTRAFSGKQGEILVAFDNDDFMWEEMEAKYKKLLEVAEAAPLRVKPEAIERADIVAFEDLPATRKVSETAPVKIYVPVDDAVGEAVDADPSYLAVRRDELKRTLGPSIAKTLMSAKDGVTTITPAEVRYVKRAVATETPDVGVKPPPRLDIVAGSFIYQGKKIERPDWGDVQADSWHIQDYFNKMAGLGDGAETMQRNYFGFMGWLYFSPFMAKARREREKESPNNADFNLIALIYGPANSGKSGLVSFLQKSMFVDGTSYPDKGKPYSFTPSCIRMLWDSVGALPLFYDDVAGVRFANTRGPDVAGETIAKEYDRAGRDRREYYPCLAVAMNADAWEFATEVRKRCLMVYANQSVPEDDVELKSNLEAAIQPNKNHIRQAFYAEYLARMGARIAAIRPGEWIEFDYLAESTGLIRDLFDETRTGNDPMPAWCKTVGWKAFDESAWSFKRAQLREQLSAKTQTREYPPRQGLWWQDDDTIHIGVGDYYTARKSNAYPSQIIDYKRSYGSLMVLNRKATVEMLSRGESEKFELPEPQPEKTEQVEPPAAPPPAPTPAPAEGRRGLLTRLRQKLF